jgi:hypothetical protein
MPPGPTLAPMWRELKRESDQTVERSSMQCSGRFRREALPTSAQGRHRPHNWLAEKQGRGCLLCLLSPFWQIRMRVDRHLESSFLRRATVDPFFQSGERPLVPQWGRHVGTLDTSMGTVGNSWPVDGSSVSTVACLSSHRWFRCCIT